MVKCSKCGCNVKHPTKTWTVTVGKTKRTKITFATFSCERCRRKFKASVKKENVPLETRRPSPPVYLRMIV